MVIDLRRRPRCGIYHCLTLPQSGQCSAEAAVINELFRPGSGFNSHPALREIAMSRATVVEIDGRMGEGGGQVLRASLALSMASGRAFRLFNIRGARPKPGLKRQHLACVLAAGEICGAEISGAEINSGEITFSPQEIRGGRYSFNIGSGGSCTLVLQAVVPALMTAGAVSHITVCGGTHVPMAPVFEFFHHTLLPRLERLGARFESRLLRPGFMHSGGGLIELEVRPKGPLNGFEETEAGDFISLSGLIRSYGLDESIACREAAVLNKLRDLGELNIEHHPADESGPGNIVLLTLARTCGLSVASGLAQVGLPAEKVARQAFNRLISLRKAGVPVDVHLADQLIVPLALAGGGSFLTEKPSLHTLTVMELLPKFGNMKARASEIRSGAWLIEIR